MAKDFIVAIELGSSKITGIAGRKNADGSINVLAVAKEDAQKCIKRGVVYNVEKTAQCLSDIVKKLSTQLKCQITKVYVGVGGQSIRSIKSVIVRELPDETQITQNMVFDLMDANRAQRYPEQEILDVAIQEYKVDNLYQTDPIGIVCHHLEGVFLNIVSRNAYYRSLIKAFNTAQINIAEIYMSPLALAESVLTDNERRSGCILVDLGAQTTTVAVFFKNLVRHLVVIPLGSDNITRDIASLQIEEKDAERMKLKYGSAYTDNADIDNSLQLPIDSTRSIDSLEFINIVEGRVEEIIRNVCNQIPAEYETKLLGGIILTGGGANMQNIEDAFSRITKIEKVRVAKFVNEQVISKNPDINAHDGRMNTVLGLLAKGNENCAGEEIDPNDIFSANKPAATPVINSVKTPVGSDAATGTARDGGTVQHPSPAQNGTAAGGEKKEETADDADKQEEKPKSEKNRQPVKKLWRNIKDWARTLTEEEEE